MFIGLSFSSVFMQFGLHAVMNSTPEENVKIVLPWYNLVTPAVSQIEQE